MGFSGIVIGVVCGESKVLGGSFGCLAGLGSRGVALVKKRSPVSEGWLSKGVANEGAFQSNFLGTLTILLWMRLGSFRAVGSLGDIREILCTCPIVARLRDVYILKTAFLV